MIIFVSIVIWVLLTPLFLLLQAPYLLKKKSREAGLDGYARGVNLALTPEVRARVIERIVLRERGAIIGYCSGLLIGLVLYFALPDSVTSGATEDSALTLPVMFGFFGTLLGIATGPVAAVTAMAARPTRGPRIARTVQPRLTDYVPPSELRSVTVAIVGAVLLFLACLIIVGPDGTGQQGPLISSVGAIYFYAALVIAVVGRVSSHRLLHAAQVAGSEQELAWDDALRAIALNGMTFSPQLLAMFAWINLSGFLVPDGLPTGVSILLAGLIATVGPVFFVTRLIATKGIEPNRHYWDRLWAPQAGATR